MQHEIQKLGAAGSKDIVKASRSMAPSSPDTTCATLQELGVRRKFCISLANKQMNAAKALVRRYCGFKWDAPEADRTKVNARAARIVEHSLLKSHSGMTTV